LKFGNFASVRDFAKVSATFCREKEHFKNAIINEIYDKVHVYLNVFYVSMLNRIFGELDGTLIITPEGGWNPNSERICRCHKAS
jgi:hypothetical protein